MAKSRTSSASGVSKEEAERLYGANVAAQATQAKKVAVNKPMSKEEARKILARFRKGGNVSDIQLKRAARSLGFKEAALAANSLQDKKRISKIKAAVEKAKKSDEDKMRSDKKAAAERAKVKAARGTGGKTKNPIESGDPKDPKVIKGTPPKKAATKKAEKPKKSKKSKKSKETKKPVSKNPNRPRNMRLGKGAGKRGTAERKLLKKAADALRLARTGAAGGAAGATALKGLTAGRALLGLSGGPLGLALLGLTAGPALYGMATGQQEKDRRARKRELDMASRMGGSPQLEALLAGKQNRQMAALADLASNAARRNQTPMMSPELQALIGGEEARLASMAQETPMSFNQAQAYAMGSAQQVADRTAPRMSL